MAVKTPCMSVDPELWFPVGTGGPAALQAEQAKSLCHVCPIELACLTQALLDGQEHGIWGGTSPEERRVILRRQGRVAWRTEDGRPPLVRALAPTA